MRTRAERRHNNNKVKNKFYKKLKETWLWWSTDFLEQYSTHNFNNRKNCSCWMCTNPRKKFKDERLTIQERKYGQFRKDGRIDWEDY